MQSSGKNLLNLASANYLGYNTNEEIKVQTRPDLEQSMACHEGDTGLSIHGSMIGRGKVEGRMLKIFPFEHFIHDIGKSDRDTSQLWCWFMWTSWILRHPR